MVRALENTCIGALSERIDEGSSSAPVPRGPVSRDPALGCRFPLWASGEKGATHFLSLDGSGSATDMERNHYYR